MTRPRRLAVAQTVPRKGDVANNLDQHLRLAALAREAGAGMVVFPELSLTGYELELAASLAFTVDDPRLRPLRDAAVSLGQTLVVGAPLRQDTGMVIASLILDEAGEVAVYTKRHLGAFPAAANPGGPVPPPEGSVFVAGQDDPAIELYGHLAALAICSDVGHESHAARAASRGARLYLASMFVIPGELATEEARLVARARRHHMVVAMANFGGASGGLPSGGRSAIWSDTGELLTRLPSAGAGLVVARSGLDGWRAEALEVADA